MDSFISLGCIVFISVSSPWLFAYDWADRSSDHSTFRSVEISDEVNRSVPVRSSAEFELENNDSHFSGRYLTSLTVTTNESMARVLKRAGLRDGDYHATLLAMNGDRLLTPMADGDELDFAFRSANRSDLLAVRFRRLGLAPVELRWDGDETPIWKDRRIDRAVLSADAVEPLQDNTHSIGNPNFVAGQISSNLYAAGAKVGLAVSEIKAFANIFRHTVDFESDLGKGDRFEVLFAEEKQDTNAEILYAKLIIGGDEIALFRGADSSTEEATYFDETGKMMNRSAVQKPLSGAEITSNYGMRIDPVRGDRRMHRGIDFRARHGTPVFAADDGIVEFLGRKGGYGKYVRLRHNAIYQSAYAHFSKFPKGLKSGDRVRKGDIIGYVGSSGRSTGPHLHFEILKHGKQVDPLTLESLNGNRSLEGPALIDFLARVSQIKTALPLMRDGLILASLTEH